MADAVHHSAASDSADHGHDHPSFLAHHFDTPEQQFDSDSLGMWLFLATEVLLFGGLFCAYAVWRGNHPEIFIAGHHHLNKMWGAINTVVLLLSSFTMAWAVTCAQRGNQGGLKLGLALTLLGGVGFMGIKTVEYTEKVQHGLLWGTGYQPHVEHHAAAAAHDDHVAAPALEVAETVPAGGADPGHADAAHASDAPAPDHAAEGDRPVATPLTAGAYVPVGLTSEASKSLKDFEETKILPSAVSPRGLAAPVDPHAAGPEPKATRTFFAIYFMMTGLHGIHVLAGMGVITWLLVKAVKGHFSAQYFTPVHLGGLYWHLVDLIWIYLFPLLYLIH